MGTITGTAIITSAAFMLQDAGNLRWTRSELLGYLNDGQRDLCVVKPDAFTVNAAVLLAAGTKQALPTGGTGFVRLARNMGTTGTTAGKVPRRMDLDVLDKQDPNWHTRSTSVTVLEYAHDARDPKVFYVSPPQPATGQGQVELVYFGTPTALAAEASTIALDDIYKTALEHYIAYRAYLKDGESSEQGLATLHRGEFLALLGAKQVAEEAA